MSFFSQSFLFVLVCTICSTFAAVISQEQKNCSCGFSDSGTGQFFTDSLIVYFNESRTLPGDWVVEEYEHTYEKDWDSVYRQGADPFNVQQNNSEALELFVSIPTQHHLVNGGGIRTLRRDIQFGSFRVLFEAPRHDSGGSALSLLAQYNETQSFDLSVMNTNKTSEAWVGTFINNEFTSRDLGVNFSDAMNSVSANRNYPVLQGLLTNSSINPWEFTEYRIDWTKEIINFYIGGNLSRSVSRNQTTGLPSVPAPLSLKHWSTGNPFSMSGPPSERAGARVGWARFFFNSSSTGKDEMEAFSACSISDVCSVDDIYLRGSTEFSSSSATRPWKQKNSRKIERMPALWVSVVCVSLSTFLLIHTILRRSMQKQQASEMDQSTASDALTDSTSTSDESPRDSVQNRPGVSRSVSSQPSTTEESQWQESEDEITIITRTDDTAINSPFGSSNNLRASCAPSLFRSDSEATTLRALSPYSSDFNITSEDLTEEKNRKSTSMKDQGKAALKGNSTKTTSTLQIQTIPEGKVTSNVTEMDVQPVSAPAARRPRERIDYLAGLVALCAILVTVMHFGLTFLPAIVIPGAPVHYHSETWAQKLISPFILNQMWLGVFFTTSTRFLVAPYLKRGSLKDVAKSTVRRCPRLMIPVTAVALLEYFLIDCGITTYLRYIPSLTWSTWPYVTRFPTIGHFISEILELFFLIPNAVPQITFNFCTGVLWTLAVQLQGSWLVLTGVIVIHEIRSPWKRIGYYFFCISNHWYAESWGSYLWFGLLLTDLDITYVYKPYLYARPWTYYPLILSCWLLVALGFLANMLPNWNLFNFNLVEHNIHPDVPTGQAIMYTASAGYPAYYVPRFNGLIFAAGLQAIIELSITIQSLLSIKPILWLFPHIFSIYLLHGLIFWSWGSWLLVILADHHFSYGVSLVAVGVTSYALIFTMLPVATPVIESLGKDLTALIWWNATEVSPPRRRTLFPFPEDLLTRERGSGAATADLEASAGLNGVLSARNCGKAMVPANLIVTVTPAEKTKVKENLKGEGFDFECRGA